MNSVFLNLRVGFCTFLWATALAPAATSPAIAWVVRLTDDGGAVRVSVQFPPELLARRSTIALQFVDRLGSPTRLISITARSNERQINVVATGDPRGQTYKIDVTRLPGPLDVDYTIDPTFPWPLKGQPADARSRATPDMAVLRTSSVFARTDVDAPTNIRFVLPKGWIAATPWIRDGTGFVIPANGQSAVNYIAIGPFDVREIDSGGDRIRVAVAHGQTDLTVETVAAIVEREVRFFGNSSLSSGLLIVVPASFMWGGASGDHTAVQGPRPDVVAHEVFHWWNASQVSRPESEWFHEGFTEYYGLEIAKAAAGYTQEDACLADLDAEMRYLEADRPVSLADASDSHGDRRMERLLYSKGALLALLLDRQLHTAGRSLDDVMREVLTSKRRGLGNDELEREFARTYGGMVDTILRRYVDNANRLPDLQLGTATGKSGCAFFQSSRGSS